MDTQPNVVTYGAVRRRDARRVVRRVLGGLAVAAVCAWAIREAAVRSYWYERNSIVATLRAIPGARLVTVNGLKSSTRRWRWSPTRRRSSYSGPPGRGTSAGATAWA